jgi:hypothetical protein
MTTKSSAPPPVDQMQEGQIHQPSQSEELPSGVLPFDAPGQLFPEGLNEIDDEQCANSTSEGDSPIQTQPDSPIQTLPEAVEESVSRRSGRI